MTTSTADLQMLLGVIDNVLADFGYDMVTPLRAYAEGTPEPDQTLIELTLAMILLQVDLLRRVTDTDADAREWIAHQLVALGVNEVFTADESDAGGD